jgi:hypothetical protein
MPRWNFQFQIGHILGTDMVPLLERQRRLDRPLHINLRWIALDIEARHHKLEGRAQVPGQDVPVELGTEEDLDIPLAGLNNTVMAEETCLRQQRRFNALTRRRPGMCRLHHGARVGGQPAGMRGRNAQGHPRLGALESEHLRAGGSGSHRTKQARGMKTAQVAA